MPRFAVLTGVGMGEGGMQGIRGGIWFGPGNVVDDPKFKALESETYAEDDVVRTCDPNGSIGLQDASRLPEPAQVELVVLLEAAERTVPGSFIYRS